MTKESAKKVADEIRALLPKLEDVATFIHDSKHGLTTSGAVRGYGTHDAISGLREVLGQIEPLV